MPSASLSTVGVVALLMMSISGVATWWANNILRDISKVRVFAAIGTISAITLVWTTW